MNKVHCALVACVGVWLSGCGNSATEPAPRETESTPPSALTVNGGDVTGSIQRGAHADLDFEFGCDNRGSTIVWSGHMLFDDVDANLIAKNNMKGTHTADAGSVEVSAGIHLTDPDSIEIPKQPPRGGAGGNPWIYFRASSTSGAPLGEPVLLGRCKGQSAKHHVDFIALSQLVLRVDPVDNNTCKNSGGPTIRIDGTLESVGEFKGEVWFQNQRGETPRHVTDHFDADLELVIRAEGAKATFAKSPHLGGAGGNPLLFVKLLDPFPSAELLLGRCNKL